MKTAQLLNTTWILKMGRNVKSFKYVGNKCDKMVNGCYYTYQDIADVNGMLVVSIRNRMTSKKCYLNGERVITDEILQPKIVDPFITLEGEKAAQYKKKHLPDECRTPSEKLMAKHLRMRL